MKKLLLLTFLGLNLACAAQSWQWAVNYDNAGLADRGNNIGIDKNDNLYISGVSYNPYGGGFEMLSKYSPAGSLIWTDSLPLNNKCSVTDADGNTFIVGYYKIAKYNSTGQLLWIQNIPNAFFKTVALFPAGGIVVAGTNWLGYPVAFGSYNLSGNKEFFSARCDNDGNWLWAIEDEFFGAASIAISSSGKIYQAGFAWNTNPYFIKCYDENGNFQAGMAPNLSGSIKYSTVDKDGYIYVMGQIGSGGSLIVNGNSYPGPSGTYSNVFIVKFDSTGHGHWVKMFNGYTTGDGIVADKNNNIYIAGAYGDSVIVDNLHAFGGSQSFVVKIDENGNALWLKSGYSSSNPNAGTSQARDIVLNSNDDPVITGAIARNVSFDNIYLTAPMNWYDDLLIAKISQPISTGYLENHISTSDELEIYPNPSTSNFSIKINLSEKDNLHLKIYNTNGSLIYSQLLPEFNTELTTAITLNAPPGVYYLTAEGKKNTFVKRLVIY